MTRPLLALALGAALAAPAAAATGPQTAVVDLGGARVYVRADQGSPLAGIELLIRAGLDRETGAENGLAALVAEIVLHTPVDGVPLDVAVDARGAAIGYAVAAQSVRFFLEGTPEGLAASAPLAARALGAPAFDAATLGAARAALGERIGDAEGDARLVGIDMLRSSYYRGGAGLPKLGNPAALAALTPDDAKRFYGRWYLRGDAVVAAVGRTGSVTDAASRALVAALPGGSAPAAKLTTRAFGTQPKRIVTHRDVYAPYVALGFAAPALGDRDFAAALVVRTLLSSLFERVGATTLPPVFRSMGAIYAYDAAPAQFVLWINGSRVDPAIGIAAVDAVVKAAAAKPLGAAALARYKDTARGEWSLETLSLDQRAFAVGNAVLRGLDADAAEAVGPAIARVTAADLQRVTKTYFQRFDVALVMPRGDGG